VSWIVYQHIGGQLVKKYIAPQGQAPNPRIPRISTAKWGNPDAKIFFRENAVGPFSHREWWVFPLKERKNHQECF
jgi:hypothetical protein